MKKTSTLIISGILFSLLSCGSTPNSVVELTKETDEVEIVLETAEISDDDEVIDLNEEVEELSDYYDSEDEEYLRSTNNLSSDQIVTKEEFADDKSEILRIIEELQDVMNDEDAKTWLTYIAPDSIKYYSNPANIRKAQKKLPNKTIVLNGIGDYFKYVFIPSRKRSEVKEIRYISKTNIKAVDVKSDGSLIVYYQFVKINNKWLVHIPTL